MLSQDGVLMCRCSEKRLNWYLERGLGEVVEVNGDLAVRLNFVPKGLGKSNDQFYIEEKSNICVVCGSKEELFRVGVVPSSYRKYFPIHVKSRSSFDKVLLCKTCKLDFDVFLGKLYQHFASVYQISVEGDVDDTLVQLQRGIRRQLASLRALSNSKVPEHKKVELKNVFIEFLKQNGDHFSMPARYEFDQRVVEAFLEEADYILARDCVMRTHGELVVDKCLEMSNSLDPIIFECRKRFLQAFNPRFLSRHWYAEHQEMNF